jgi:hypothetical protein
MAEKQQETSGKFACFEWKSRDFRRFSAYFFAFQVRGKAVKTIPQGGIV